MPYDLLSFLLLRTKKKANMQFNRKLLTSLFIGQYNVEKTQTSPPTKIPNLKRHKRQINANPE